MGLAVSAAPGANMGLCVGLARRRLADALPLIISAAITDASYALCCSLGLLAAVHIDRLVLAWLSVALLALAAYLIWPAEGRRCTSLSAASIAALNPATCALWLSISAALASTGHTQQPPAVALGALLATASWFTAVGAVCSRLPSRSPSTDRVGQAFSLVLVAMALVRIRSGL